MAAPSQVRNLWLTIGAAAVTLVVVAGVLAGPGLMACYGNPAGLLACMRQEVVDVGLLPSRDVQSTPEVAPAAPAVVADVPPDEPVLNLIRAEPDGSVVLAGTGKPGISVQVFADDIVIGEAQTEASGDWVVIPEKPLVTGGAEITVGVVGDNTRSGQSFVVVINPDRKSEPLVVASTLGEASKVLQGLPEVAPVPEPVAEPTLALGPTPAPEVATAPPPVTEPEPQPIIEPQPAPTADATAPVEPPVAAPGAKPEGPPPVQPEIVTTPVPTLVEPPIDVAEAKPLVPPPVEPETVLAPAPQPTIDAIEIDGSVNFFAGAGPEGATIRLYVDDRFIADAKVEGGRWLVEASGALTLERQRVRIDLLAAGTADVAARAEVNFVVEMPANVVLDPAAGGSAGTSVSASNDMTLTPASEPSDTAEIPEPVVEPQVQDEVAEAAEPEIPTLTASPVADPEKLRFASGKAIIRRGENLWTIARRVYGDGMKYTTIFDANKDQMRSPEHIYPGQVFDLPKVQEDPSVN